MSDSRKIVDNFCDGYSCSQAILTGYAERYGMDGTVAMRLAAGLGGGLGRTGGTCGAVSGAALVLGLELGGEQAEDKAGKERTYEAVTRLVREFEARNGSSLCRELLECDISKPDEYARAREQDLFHQRCPHFVATAVELLDAVIGKDSAIEAD